VATENRTQYLGRKNSPKVQNLMILTIGPKKFALVSTFYLRLRALVVHLLSAWVLRLRALRATRSGFPPPPR